MPLTISKLLDIESKEFNMPTPIKLNVQFTDEDAAEIQAFCGTVPNMGVIFNDDPRWKTFYDKFDEFSSQGLPVPVSE